MWRRYSVSDLDIFDLVQDVRTKMGTQGLASHDIDRSPQFVFQQKRDGHEVVEGFFARRKFDQQIYVTLRIGVISLKRPKQGPMRRTPSRCKSSR